MTFTKKYHLKEQKIPRGFQIWLGKDGVEVAGIQFRRDAATEFVTQENHWLEFEAEPSNNFDEHAIKILGCYRENEEIVKLHIGYVPTGLSKKITLFPIQKCTPRLFKTYIGKSGYVEIQFQVLASKGSNNKNDNSNIFNSLSNDARSLVQEKPRSWEYRLFFQIWIDELNLLHEKITKYNNPFKDDQIEFDFENLISWGKSQLDKINEYIKHINKLINVEANNAFGPPGEAGDDKSIILVAKDVAQLLEKLLDWSMHIRSFKTEEPLSRVLSTMSRLPGSAIATLIEFPYSALNKIEKALAVASPGNRQQVDLTIDLTISNLDEFDSAFDDMYKYYGI